MAIQTQSRDSIGRFVKKLRDVAVHLPRSKVALFQKKVALSGLKLLVMSTPVRVGRARGGWVVQLSGSSKWVPEKTDIDPSGKDTIASGLQEIQKMEPFGTTYITNNVEYILHLEHGTSTQAPHGMLRMTLHALLSMFKK